MCGIVGILSCPSHRHVPDAKDILSLLDSAVEVSSNLDSSAEFLEQVDQLLRGDAGILALAGNHSLASDILTRLNVLDEVVDVEEARIDEMHVDSLSLDQAVERASRVRDALWAIRRDRLRTADAVHALAGRGATPSSIVGYLSIQQALSAIDRMEVRGRDSAGISVIVSSPELHNAPIDVVDAITQRGIDPLFTNRSVRYSGNTVVFVYKAAAEIGELGDNTRHMRASLAADDLLRKVLSLKDARTSVLGHTRWASVGIISEPNAHPVTSEEVTDSRASVSMAVLNGDVDNHADLKARHNLRFADPITTDAKVIPALVDRGRTSGMNILDAFLNHL